ncbi:MAG: hypothetical protein CL927_00490 [Deltaproteobacteria bacterium]|nr:hypothetical protein [Deltaproteobacteria bacterium]HCH64481.1 hypothetical protein [Deltaproteobacteria bacterium]
MKPRHATIVTLGLGLCLAACSRRGAVESRSALSPRLQDHILQSVVLITPQLPDERIGYGAGVRVGGGRIVTNAHVIDGAQSIHVLPWRPDRSTYIDVDGGLSRLIFESQSEMHTARVLSVDVTLDLAVLQVDGLPPLDRPIELSTRTPKLGEPILAVGHPRGEVWSISFGHISALHQGVVQHDAPINKGNSGGPLLDRTGTLLGINTRKPMERTEGIGFARPTEMVHSLIQPDADSAALDRTTPDAAFMTCMRATELGQPLDDCLSWRHLRAAIIDGVVQSGAREEYSAEALEELERVTKANLTTRMVRDTLKLNPELQDRVMTIWGGLAMQQPLQLEVQPQVLTSEAAYAPTLEERLQNEHGMMVDIDNPAAIATLLRNGLRVLDMWPHDEAATWLALEGRNHDGSTYRLSQLMVEHNSLWSLCVSPSADAIASLPEGWPPPLATHDQIVETIAQRATLQTD